MFDRILRSFTINGYSQGVREETLDGVKYLVVPTVMITKGIHNGSNGPLDYPPDELAKSVIPWNNKPIVVEHPITANGLPASAANPTILAKSRVGFLLNTSYDADTGKLKTESWIDIEKANSVDTRIISNIRQGITTEVSTGLDADIVIVNGVPTAINHRPDHFAILFNGPGACDIKKGAGLLANHQGDVYGIKAMLSVELEHNKGLILNGLSFGETHNSVYKALCNKFGEPGKTWYGDVVDLYNNQVVYADPSGKTYSHSYKMDGNTVSLVGDPQQVLRVSKYTDTQGNMIGNSSQEKDMTKPELIGALIANGIITEALKGEFEKMSIEALTALHTKSTATQQTTTPAPIANSGTATTQTPAPKILTPAEELSAFLSSAPAPVRTILTNALQQAAEAKKAMITTILNAAGNTMTEAELIGLPENVLKQMVSVMPASATSALSLSPEITGYLTGAPLQIANNTQIPKPLARPDMYAPEAK